MAGGALQCQKCSFLAWNDSQLKCHMTWHNADDSRNSAKNRKEFVCSACPCSVTDLGDFKFHLQFHKQENKGKYYQCTNCPFKSNIESCIENHHKSEHASKKASDSSDEEDGSYIVKKFKVPFHGGMYQCPNEACTDALGTMRGLQEHHRASHGYALDEKFMLDFVLCEGQVDVHTLAKALLSGAADTVLAATSDSGNEGTGSDLNSADIGLDSTVTSRPNSTHTPSDIFPNFEPVVVTPIADNVTSGISGTDVLSNVDNSFALGGATSATELFQSMTSVLGLNLEPGEIGNIGTIGTPPPPPLDAPESINVNEISNVTDISMSVSEEGQDSSVIGAHDSSKTNENVLGFADVKEEDDDMEEPSENAFHCDMCEYSTNIHEEFIDHITVVHNITVVAESSFDTPREDDNAGGSKKKAITIGERHPAGGTKLCCHICPYITNHRRNFKKHLDIHDKVKSYSGPAFKCGHCPYIAMSKGPGCNHVRNLHGDKPFKLFFVEKRGSEILYQEEVAMNKAILAAERSLAKSTENGALNNSSHAAFTPKTQKEKPQSMPEVLPAKRAIKKPDTSNYVKDDWLVELTKDEAAFCYKMAGLMKYKCRICDYMDENCGKVRVHYVSAHPGQLPILCGYCRERCEPDEIRGHHASLHPLLPLKVIRQVLENQNTSTPQLELNVGEIEIEEVIDKQGLNDWTAAMRDFVVMETSGTYRCVFCQYKQYGTSALKRHVFPIHFKCYPYSCQYCKIGMTQVNQLKNHIEKMHPNLPVRVRRPLAMVPTEAQIARVKQNTDSRPNTEKNRSSTDSPSLPSPSYRQQSPVRASTSSPYAGSSATSTPPAESLFLDPNTIKQEPNTSDFSPRSSEHSLSPSGERIKGMKKSFRCHYCNHSSKWTGRDVQRHILTTHLGLRLFNCVYCDFGCYSRGRLEAHCATEHPNRPFKVSNLDKRINSVQVVRENPDGVDILALYTPNGEPVLSLNPTNRAALRRSTLSGKYQLFTRPQDGKTIKESPIPQQKISPVVKTTPASDRTAVEKGRLMKPSIKDNVKQAWRCTLCDLVLTRCDRIKYHIICHHWKIKPYLCPLCETYKFQREPVTQHMLESHPGCTRDPINVCDLRKDELSAVIQRIDNPDEVAKLTGTTPQPIPITRTVHFTPSPKQQQKPRNSLSPKISPAPQQQGVEPMEEEESQDDEDVIQEELWQCLERDCGFVGPYQPVQNHVLQKHLKTQVYCCDFCASTRNDIERMVDHLRQNHPNMPQRFSHAYGKYKETVDKLIGRLTQLNGTSTVKVNSPRGVHKHVTSPNKMAAPAAMTPLDLSIVDSPRNDTPVSEQSYSSEKLSGSLASPEMTVYCPVCKLKVKNQADLDWHLVEEHPQYVKYQCGYCSTVSESKGTLRQHMISTHSDKPPEYSMVRNLPASMEASSVASTSPGGVVAAAPGGAKICKMCGFVTQSLAVLNDHLETKHLSQVLFQCKLCAGLHKTKADLMTHYGVLHKEDSLQYKVVPLGAEDDEEDMGSEEGATDKLGVEDGCEMYECEACAYATTNAADFSRHKASHSARRPSTDSLSSAGFSSADSLRRKSIDTIISENDSTTSRTSSPQMFVNRYECKICTYVTRECVSIRRHVMTHIQYYPYKCRYCDVSSIRSNAVKKHMENIHKDALAQPMIIKDNEMEEKIRDSINKVFGDTPKRILKKNAGNYLPPLSQTMNAPSPFARGLNSKPKSQIQIKAEKEEPMEEQEADPVGKGAEPITTEGAETAKKGMKYVCRICKYVVYGVHQNIRRHVMIHFNYKKYKCPYCEFATIQSHGVTQHVVSAHPGASARYLTFSQDDLEKKIQENIIKTGECALPSPSKSKQPSALQVVQNITKKYGYTSSLPAGMRGKSQLGISKKKKYHVDPSKIPPGRLLYYKCKICNFTENSSLRKCTNMRRHVMSHLDYKRYKCNICDFGSTTTCMTKAHMRRKHPGDQHQLIDDKDERLERAMRANIIKVGGKPYTTYMYQDSGSERKPDLTPTPERPFPRFSKQPKPMPLLEPESMGQGNYKCLICNKKTLTSTTMKRHCGSHFNYRRYGCPYCELLFTQSTFVLNHVRSKHVGQRQHYLDCKVAETEAKVKESFVNLKEFEKSGVKVEGQPQSKLKLLLTKKSADGDIYGSSPVGDNDLNFIDGEVDDSDYNFQNGGSEFQNGDYLEDEFNNSDVSSAGTIEYADSPSTLGENDEENRQISRKISHNASEKPDVNGDGAFTCTYYRCVRCFYTTEHKTSMLRHIMWKIQYKPYQCPHCGFQDVLVNGLRKHCLRRHKGLSQTPLLCKNAEQEYEVELLMEQSTITPDNPMHSVYNKRQPPAPGPIPRASPKKVLMEVPGKKIKLEPDVRNVQKKLPVTRQMFDEPIDEKIIYNSQVKLQCQLCNKRSTSRGYIYNHVLRHGPPRLMCSYCKATMYFPKEAKTHSEHKHPGQPLNIKRLWGNRTWDHKNIGIERATERDVKPVIAKPEPQSDFKTSDVKSRDVSPRDLKPRDHQKQLSPRYRGIQAREQHVISEAARPHLMESPIPGQDDYPPRLPKPPHIKCSDKDFENTIIERTPVRIPKRNTRTGYYNCIWCDYATTNANHIKCHVLVHEPPHWRCDHCNKRFIMLYKLRKHTATSHGKPLNYTNLITNETCVDGRVNYANAVLESPARRLSLKLKAAAAAQREESPLTESPMEQSPNDPGSPNTEPLPYPGSSEESAAVESPADYTLISAAAAAIVPQQSVFPQMSVFPQGELMHMGAEGEEGARVEEEEMFEGNTTEDDDVTNDDNDVSSDEIELILTCYSCPYRTYSVDDLAEHVHAMHTDKDSSNDVQTELLTPEGAVIHMQPMVAVDDFLKLPIEELHALMVEHGLEEIHQ